MIRTRRTPSYVSEIRLFGPFGRTLLSVYVYVSPVPTENMFVCTSRVGCSMERCTSKLLRSAADSLNPVAGFGSLQSMYVGSALLQSTDPFASDMRLYIFVGLLVSMKHVSKKYSSCGGSVVI